MDYHICIILCILCHQGFKLILKIIQLFQKVKNHTFQFTHDALRILQHIYFSVI